MSGLTFVPIINFVTKAKKLLNNKKYPLSVGGEERLKGFEIFSGGFLLGMLAMYIAVHLYRWK